MVWSKRFGWIVIVIVTVIVIVIVAVEEMGGVERGSQDKGKGQREKGLYGSQVR